MKTELREHLGQTNQAQAGIVDRRVTGSPHGIRSFLHKMARATRLGKSWRRGGHGHQNGKEISAGEVMASCGQAQDQDKVNNIRPLHGFQWVYSAPAELRMTERVALYSLVFGLQPRNCLEVGTFRAGSSAIICGALDDTGFGQLACVDPTPRIAPELWSRISHRCRLFEGASPAILPEVAEKMGGLFDFAFIDADHPYESVRRDIGGVLPVLAGQAYLLFHDAHSKGVKKAIDEAVAHHPYLVDCGLISVEETTLQQNGQPVHWAGLRLLRIDQDQA